MAPRTQSGDAWSARADGLAVTVRVTTKSSRDSLQGIELLSDGRAAVKARVRAVPEDGKANAALVKVLAEALGVPARDVHLESGATARLKTFVISGDPATLDARLSEALEDS